MMVTDDDDDDDSPPKLLRNQLTTTSTKHFRVGLILFGVMSYILKHTFGAEFSKQTTHTRSRHLVPHSILSLLSLKLD